MKQSAEHAQMLPSPMNNPFMRASSISAFAWRGMILGACLSAAALFGIGCGKSGPQPAGSATVADKPKIALVMKSLANEFFSTMAEGAKKHQAANSIRYS